MVDRVSGGGVVSYTISPPSAVADTPLIRGGLCFFVPPLWGLTLPSLPCDAARLRDAGVVARVSGGGVVYCLSPRQLSLTPPSSEGGLETLVPPLVGPIYPSLPCARGGVTAKP